MTNTFTLISASANAYTQAATAEGPVKMSKDELIKMIENAGFEAVERDTVYNRVDKVPA